MKASGTNRRPPLEEMDLKEPGMDATTELAYCQDDNAPYEDMERGERSEPARECARLSGLDYDDDGADGDCTPPYGNYGGLTYQVDVTQTQHEAQTSGLASRPGGLLLDYLRAVLPDTREVWAELDVWLGERTARPFGWHNWYTRSAMVLDGGLVAWCDDKDQAEKQGVLIDLPGKACAYLGARLILFLQWCLDNGHVTRADYAVDDFKGRITPDKVYQALESGAVVRRYREYARIQNGGIRRGYTVYIGKRSASSIVRVYDKAAEQGIDASWTRFEFETKGPFSDRLAREYFLQGADAIIGQVNRRLRFCEPSDIDSNRRRWVTSTWWAEFIGSLDRGPSLACGEKPSATVDSMARFVEQQAGPALATILQADGGDLGRVFGIVERSGQRMKAKHYAALALVEAERQRDGSSTGDTRSTAGLAAG